MDAVFTRSYKAPMIEKTIPIPMSIGAAGRSGAGPAFLKMHGLGNDFVVLDARRAALGVDRDRARRIAARHTGIGCDQVVVLAPPRRAGADVFMAIRNADGEEVWACGNAARCVAALMLGETGASSIAIETLSGVVTARAADNGHIAVDMGIARTGWRDIPLARACDTLHLPLSCGPLSDPVGVSMGNPHAVFFVGNIAESGIERCGPILEHDPLFPERANIGVGQVESRDRLRLRVWERGAGLTLACGTGACAAVVAGIRRNLLDRSVTVLTDGGALTIDVDEADRVVMTGPVAFSYEGVMSPAIWDGAP